MFAFITRSDALTLCLLRHRHADARDRRYHRNVRMLGRQARRCQIIWTLCLYSRYANCTYLEWFKYIRFQRGDRL